MAALFFSYSHKDEDLRDQLETQLAMLKRQGVIETWHDRRIGAGDDLHHAISAHVEQDDVILLLVSADFLASDYCYDVEMTRVMERHNSGQAVVIPVILRACDWHGAPFGHLMATPPDGKPVTQWPDRDQAFLEVTKAIRKAVEKLEAMTPTAGSTSNAVAAARPRPAEIKVDLLQQWPEPRSSNLALAKRFTDRDKDVFLSDAFDYMAKFFESSVAELARRNADVEGDFRRIDANRFFITAYRDGAAVAQGTVFMGGMFARSINYVQGHAADSNGYNESLLVEADDQALSLRAMHMDYGRRNQAEKLTFEGAAELYWNIFISPLQQR